MKGDWEVRLRHGYLKTASVLGKLMENPNSRCVVRRSRPDGGSSDLSRQCAVSALLLGKECLQERVGFTGRVCAITIFMSKAVAIF